MTPYTVQPGDRIFLIGFGFVFLLFLFFVFFANDVGMCKCANDIGKNVSKNLKGEYTHKMLYYAKQSATDELKPASEKAI